MATRTPVIYLHVGAMKTGTSYLQKLLAGNKEALLDAGVLFPGERGWSDQVLAVRDVLGLRIDNENREHATGAWNRLRAEMMAHEGVSVVSMEFLSFASPRKARAVLRSLRNAEVHVILTVRDASRVIPAQWQETTQNRGTTSWPTYVQAILSEDRDSSGWRAFQRALNIPRMLDAWGSVLPEGRLHVVLVPSAGARPEELWERFASVIGVDPAVCSPPTSQHNASLGYASADLMRRVNVAMRDLGQQAYNKTMKAYLAKQVLSGRAGEPKVTTHRALSEFALNWNRSMADAVAKSGAIVVGEPSDLDVVPSEASDLAEPAVDEVLAAAREAVDGLNRVIATRAKRLESARRDADVDVEPGSSAPAVDMDAWAQAPDPLAAAVADVSALARHAVDVRARQRWADGKPPSDTTFDSSAPTDDSGRVGKALRRMRDR